MPYSPCYKSMTLKKPNPNTHKSLKFKWKKEIVLWRQSKICLNFWFWNTDIRISVYSNNNAYCKISFMERNVSVEVKAWSFALQKIILLWEHDHSGIISLTFKCCYPFELFMPFKQNSWLWTSIFLISLGRVLSCQYGDNSSKQIQLHLILVKPNKM